MPVGVVAVLELLPTLALLVPAALAVEEMGLQLPMVKTELLIPAAVEAVLVITSALLTPIPLADPVAPASL